MATKQQKRHFTRVPFDADVRLVKQSGEAWDSRLFDISLKGALIEAPNGWSADRGDEFLLEIFLAGEDIKIDMNVSVAHIGDGRAGFHCEFIDIDSISHLHRLMELNMGDEAQLEREISDMIGVRP